MKRKFGKTRFLAYLKKLDQSINYKVILISMGGTALSLSDTKLYSDDIDLTYLAKKGRDFEKKARAVARRMAIPENGLHLFSKAETITLTNIPDYADRAIDFEGVSFKHIDLKIMNIYDIILTKIKRFDGRDIDDLNRILKHLKINKGQLSKRYNILYLYQNDQRQFYTNYQAFKKMFKSFLK